MNEKKDIPTSELWALIEANALLAQKHTKWDMYLTHIKVLVQMIEDRIKRYQETEGCGQLGQESAALDDKTRVKVDNHG